MPFSSKYNEMNPNFRSDMGFKRLGIFFNLYHLNSPSQFCPKHNFQPLLYYNLKSFSILINPQIQTYPVKEIEFQSDNSIKYNHLSHILLSSVDNCDILLGSSIHTHLIKLNPNGFISIWNKLLSLYCKFMKIQYSLQLFDEMPQRDVVSYNTLLSTSFRCNCGISEGLRLFSNMKRESIEPNYITLSVIIGACANSSVSSYLVEVIHGQAIRYGFSSSHFVGSSLVGSYSKQHKLEKAIRAFDEISELDLVSWNIMIDNLVRNECKEQAMKVFLRLRNEGVEFDCFTLASMTKMCSDSKDLNRGMEIHGCVLKAGLAFETANCNALITMYSKCEDEMVSATKVFEKIQEPNIISWTAIIAGLMQNGQNKEAIGFYRRMIRVGMKENEFSFASILPAYSSLASLEQGMQIHARIVKSRFGSDLSVGNALIDMYFKCGSLIDAKIVFETLETRDVISWTVMITGFGQHGEGREALELLKTMTIEGFKPDDVTFIGCLSACSHGGFVDEGLQVFRSMVELHGIKPRREHFACVVDMLGRAGRLKEAEIFIEEMGIGSEAFVWEALLGACRIHGEIELGEISAKKIKELEPKRNGPYVLLANIYADKGLWEEKEKVRESLGLNGLTKQAGSSWVAS